MDTTRQDTAPDHICVNDWPQIDCEVCGHDTVRYDVIDHRAHCPTCGRRWIVRHSPLLY